MIGLPPGSTNPSKTFNILTEFQVENRRFLVVSLSNNLENNWFGNLPESLSSFHTEVQRFEVQGRMCVIAEIHQKSRAAEIDLATLLTDRELQIATLVALGRSNKQVAKLLKISEWTVSTHLRRIFIKLDVDSRAAMVYCCASLIHQLQKQAEPLKTKTNE